MSDLMGASSDLLPPLTSLSGPSLVAPPVSLPLPSNPSARIGTAPSVSRSSTLNIGGAYPSACPPLMRNVSASSRSVTVSGGGVGVGGVGSGEWRTSITVEERISLRRKLKEAFRSNCDSYEKLLETVTAIDEELIFASAISRIDYFKHAIDWDARIKIKRTQLNGAADGAASTVTRKRTLDDTTSLMHLDANDSGSSNSVVVPSTGSAVADASLFPSTPPALTSASSRNSSASSDSAASPSPATNTKKDVEPTERALRQPAKKARN